VNSRKGLDPKTRARRSEVIAAIMATEDRAKVAKILRRERIAAHARGMEEGYLFACREGARQADVPGGIRAWLMREINRLVARGVK
jgi:hypothetical protein